MKKKLVNILKHCICEGESKEDNEMNKKKLDNLICEGNKYYDLKKCGIGLKIVNLKAKHLKFF